MISVTFTSDAENVVATEHLYQWDNGQKLSISGVGTTADIHFANKKSEKALVVTPTVTSGACVAPIPNSLLAEPYPIIAYVYVPSDNGSKTIKSVTINVEARKQPSDFVLDEDEGITTLESISQRVNEMIQNATNQVNTAIANMQTDYTNFKNTIQGELADMVANTTIPNADTVDGHHASDFALSENPSINGEINLTNWNATHTVKIFAWEDTIVIRNNDANGNYTDLVIGSNGIYKQMMINGEYAGRTNINDGGNADTANTANTASTADTANTANTASTADTANTAGTLATTATNVCLRNISFGTAQPQITNPNTDGYVAPGALYAVYE